MPRSTPRTRSSRPASSSGDGAPPKGAQGPPVQIGRIPILGIGPVVEGGRWPARAVTGEPVPITANIFREGHDAVAAQAVLINPEGGVHSRVPMTCPVPGTDQWIATVVPDREGDWSFRVEAYSDPFATWEHAASIKVHAGLDVELMLTEGALLFERALGPEKAGPERTRRTKAETAALTDGITGLRDTSRPAPARMAAGTSAGVHTAFARIPLRDLVTVSDTYRLTVQREKALFSAWYEMFPRSQGATFNPETGRWTSGTFATAAQRLPAIAELGFDVVYLPPIHPIGVSGRKGPNNTLTPAPGDPGSPWAIGAAEGGHDAIHPDLGTFEDFAAFVARANELGLEVALDLALQCSPDHPWVKEHPEWFTTRADGSIAYAENPPKKYQDIYPVNFDNDPEGIYAAVLEVVRGWIARGVTIFRVDNPHTKPVSFWERLIGQINAESPQVLFLAEAFTRPSMMHTLGRVGFHQSYTYFTWRTGKAEITEYITELTGDSAAYMRPNFWPNTPDILHEFLQYGGMPAFKLRAVLAATLSPSWGIYSGYELCEHVAVQAGSEEYLDSEKYQYRPRDWERYAPGGPDADRSIAPYLGMLNRVRREHPALRFLRGTTFHHSGDDSILCYSRRVAAAHSPTGREDTLIVVINLDPHGTRETQVSLDLAALGVTGDFIAHDVVSGQTWRWGEHNYVRLDPHHEPAHIIHVRRL